LQTKIFYAIDVCTELLMETVLKSTGENAICWCWKLLTNYRLGVYIDQSIVLNTLKNS